MKLKSLHLKGFKSFPLNTVIHFEDKVTGIVGPNGSGKSNIVDAIRWVLGEQSNRELRLESMGDIIFNGTKTRKESGLAQVSLTFDNTKNLIPTEYQSVTISRLLYRSGESEYRINNTPCRLKDVRSLFIDTGIGSNSYAIIALGMVDDILENKENARRRMFEQAAGISKFKIRKRETHNKLKLTDADLERIQDLLFEIESNMKSLEKQANRTKKYFALKEKYKGLSIQYALKSVHTLKDRYQEKGGVLAHEENLYREKLAEIHTREAALQKEKSQNLSNEQYVSERQRAYNEIVNQIRIIENDKNLKDQKQGFNIKEKLNTLSRLENSAILQKGLAIEIENYQKKISKEREVFHTINFEKEKAETAYHEIKSSFLKVKTEIDAHTKEKNRLKDEIFEIDKNIAVHENSLVNIQEELKNFQEQRAARETDKLSISRQSKTIEQELVLLQKERDDLEFIRKNKDETIAQIQVERQKVRENLDALLRKKDAAENEIRLVKSMIEGFEGFPGSIKFLHEEWNRNAVLFSDVVEVDDRFKSVVEQYLEPYLNYFIAKDEGEAFQAIQKLALSQQGRASFFLLDRFATAKPYQATPFPDFIPAASVVNSAAPYQRLIESLLKDVYIYMGSDAFQKSLYPEGVNTVISKDGSYIWQKHSVSGGSIGLFDGKRIGRKANLEKLEAKIKDWDKEIELTSQKMNQLDKSAGDHSLEEINAQIEKVKKVFDSTKERFNQMKFAVESMLKRITELNQQIQSTEAKWTVTQSNLEKIRQEKKQIHTKLEQFSGKDLFTNEEVERLSETVNHTREEFNRLHIETIRQQNLINTIEKDLNFKEGKWNELNQTRDMDKRAIEEMEKEEQQLNEELSNLSVTLDNLYNEKKQKSFDLNELEQNYFTVKNEIFLKEEEVKRMHRELNQMQGNINRIREEYQDIRFKMSGIGERLRIEFNVSLNDIMDKEADDSISYEDLTESLEKLRLKVQNFGEINPMAVTAYEEMKERYENIYTQRNDILQARETLLETIKEIEETATSQFMNAFQEVRNHFVEVFRSLFTEDDRCDLILLNENQPLESEIEIIAQPKGKKPRSLSQLSGGEKTLTATALLFALYLLKPAPFCIFDEVDAPLDDVNIQKFNKIIQKFSHDSQFIIVTHNKSTMAEVDVLYGVYMEEPGVSGLTQVDFRSYEHRPIVDIA
ncbi:MAG TPA: chromosome segregation protein SMC [Saprospiraceae bacterium]|nr:chromosome segregation protein SMC [Saprospiraceae bacterium]